MKKISTFLLYSILIFLILGISSCSANQNVKSSTNSDLVNPSLLEAANEINKMCPFTVNKDTRLDNALALPNNGFQYNYTLVNVEKSSINVEKSKSNAASILLNQLKTNQALKPFRDNNVTIVYSYSDKNGIFLFSHTFAPEEYNMEPE